MRSPIALFPLLFSIPLLLPAPAAGGSAVRGRFERVVADTDVSLYGVQLFPGGKVFLCGADGTVARSPDGKTWRAEQLKEGLTLRVMRWTDDRTCWIAGRERSRNVVLCSPDGGESFRKIEVDLGFPIQDFAFFDRRNGWLVAGSIRDRDGAWRLTTDGGSDWRERDSVAFRLPARPLLAACTAGESRIWAVGGHVEAGLVGEAAKSLLYQNRRGSVLASDDRGQTWFVQDAGNPEGSLLWDVDFVDEKHGWVVGGDGFAARTADGGGTWKRLSTGTGARLRSVSALSGEVAFFVGDGGAALVTNDGGATFVRLPTETEDDLRDCSFTSEKDGYAVGQNGTVLRFVREW